MAKFFAAGWSGGGVSFQSDASKHKFQNRMWQYAQGWALGSLLFFFWWMMLRIVWPYTSGATDIDFLQSKQHVIHLRYYRWAFYLHIFSSLWLLAAGFTQFSSTILRSTPALHRWMGRSYVVIILFVSAPAAAVMAWHANGGIWTASSFMILNGYWWWTTFQAIQTIRRGNVPAHRRWMWRSYALTLSAITLRLMQFCLARWTTLAPDLAYQLVAYPSWLLNLALAEWYLRRRRHP